MNTKNELNEKLTKEELRRVNGFENCTDQELEKEIEYIYRLSKIMYSYLLKQQGL